MRKYAVALLAIPVLLPIVAGALLRRSIVARTGVALSLGAIIGLGAIGLARPATTVATAPTEIVPLTQAAFQMRVGTDVEVVLRERDSHVHPADAAAKLVIGLVPWALERSFSIHATRVTLRWPTWLASAPRGSSALVGEDAGRRRPR